jgi:hypothetical protein
VLLDDSGHIVHCTQCKGWEKGGRSNPCKHAGAVALARIFLRGASITVSEQPTDRPIRGRSQLYREV